MLFTPLKNVSSTSEPWLPIKLDSHLLNTAANIILTPLGSVNGEQAFEQFLNLGSSLNKSTSEQIRQKMVRFSGY